MLFEIFAGLREASSRASLSGVERQFSSHSHFVKTIWGSDTSASAEVFFESPNQIAPHSAIDPETLQDRQVGFWDFASLVRSSLAPGPIEQFEVFFDGDAQEAFITRT